MTEVKISEQNAVKLVSKFFDKVCDVKISKKNISDFTFLEEIAKGYAKLHVLRDNQFSEEEKKQMYNLISKL
jgi:hypothetical protein